jgi:hypothetical protein
VTGHSHVLLDDVSGAALCLAAYMPAAILICEIGCLALLGATGGRGIPPGQAAYRGTDLGMRTEHR